MTCLKDLVSKLTNQSLIKLPLNDGLFAVVDQEDYLRLARSRWYLVGGRVQSSRHNFLHHVVLRCLPEIGKEVDHINGDPLDNRKSNLRICTRQQNSWNMKKRGGCRSPFKGVTFEKGNHNRRPWRARIKKNGDYVQLGYFANEKDAALAYNEAAKRLFGEYASLNIVEGQNEP